jgi:hypothetical protein
MNLLTSKLIFYVRMVSTQRLYLLITITRWLIKILFQKKIRIKFYDLKSFIRVNYGQNFNSALLCRITKDYTTSMFWQ